MTLGIIRTSLETLKASRPFVSNRRDVEELELTIAQLEFVLDLAAIYVAMSLKFQSNEV